MNFRRQRDSKPELNLIPMIDVLIVLLIFLVLTTTFSREAALRIRLPEASSPQTVEEKGLEIVIDAEGRYVVNQRLVVNTQVDTLKKALLEAAGDDNDERSGIVTLVKCFDLRIIQQPGHTDKLV